MFTLYKPTPADHPVLLSIWEASVRATHHFLKAGDVEFFKNIIQQHKVFDQVDLTGVKNEQGQTVGFMGVAGDGLEMIFLHPEVTGKGTGKMLLKHAIDDLGITRVDVNEQNEEALAFYRHFGFEIISRSGLDGTGKPYPILHLKLSPQL